MKYLRILILLALGFLITSCEFLANLDTVNIPVRISEIGSTYYQDEPDVTNLGFIELYNYGNEAVDISSLTLRCSASVLGSILLYDGEFDLPSYMLQPGDYIELRSGVSTHELVPDDPGSGTFYISKAEYFPYWTNYGFAELINSGQSVDFVRFGSSSIASPSSGSFDGTAPASAYPYNSRSIGRINEDTDTDSGLDWASYNPSTPGGPN